MKEQSRFVVLLGRTILSAGLMLGQPAVTQAQSAEDLWDVTQGVTVTDHSPLLGTPYSFDIYSMFGSTLSGGTEPKSVIFADGGSPDTVQWVEWRTAAPVTLDRVVVYAMGQDASWDYARQYARVTMRTKTAGAPTYDIELFSCTPPYPARWDLTVTNLPLVTAQEFRAEFLPYPTTSAGPPFGLRTGCRVVELDAFGTVGAPSVPAPTVDLKTFAGIQVEGTPGRTYRIESAPAIDSADWVAVTNVVLPTSPFTVMDPTPISGSKRFYRAVEVPLL
jgi:hypothetical protein